MTESLRIKTYFATSVEAALSLARKELGPEAMLLNTRQSPAEARHLGQYEAVFASVPEDAAPAQSGPVMPSLEQTGIAPEILRSITAANPASIPDYLQSLIAAEPILTRPTQGREIAALVGPTGRGKTTTLVKLAVTHGLARRKPVRIFSADYLRAGAPAHLRMLAGILGVTFESCASPATLDHALRQPLPGLTLIDTPGFGPRDYDAQNVLARCLTSHAGLDSHLVLRADSSSHALATAIDRFSAFRPTRLLFTGLDETLYAGSLFSAAANSRLPVSFLANGQSIPEDLEPASVARIVELTLGASGKFAVAAA